MIYPEDYIFYHELKEDYKKPIIDIILDSIIGMFPIIYVLAIFSYGFYKLIFK